MKISVVMAAYNGSDYIIEQLNSIDNQSFNPDEIIVVDDASTDNTVSLVKDFFESTDIDGQLIVHENNMGYKNTFFDALNYADGDIIFLCDQDDVWHSDKIKRMLSVMEDNKTIKALNTSYKLIDAEGEDIAESIVNKRRNKDNRALYEVPLKEVLGYNVAMGCTLAFTRDIKERLLTHIEAIKTYNIPHDWIINIAAAMDNGLYMLNEELISYRLHKENTIGLNRADSIEKRIKDYESVADQKKDMLKLLKILDKKCFDKEYEYMKLMIKSYYIRCELLNRKRVGEYIKNYRKYKLKKVMDKKSMLYDLYLIGKNKINKKV